MGLRILLVSDYYPPFIGGAHRQTRLLAQELRQRGHSVAVATNWQAGCLAEEDDAGVRVYRLRQLRSWLPNWQHSGRQRHSPPFPDPVSMAGLQQIFRRFQPELIHSYGWLTYSCAAALIGRDIPLLVSGRDYGYGCATRTLVYRDQPCTGPQFGKCLLCASEMFGPVTGWVAVVSLALGRPLLLRKLSGFHSISSYVQAMARRDFLGQNPRVVEAVIPSFREDEADAPPEPEAALAPYLSRLPAEPFILFVGALRVVKGVQTLLAAYQRLQSPPPLVLIGTREKDSPASYPPGVQVLENFPHRAVLAAWDRALFGVLPSLWPEPLGSVVYEGMSRGKAVIGTVPGGHSDMIVDGETGRLVPPGDEAALAQAMQALIDDPDMCRRYGRAGRERARLFTASVSVPAFERLYGQLLRRAPSETTDEIQPLPLGQR